MRGDSPTRTCVGCGQRDSKKGLVRFTLGPEGFELDHEQGRGGYLHSRENCWRAFLKRKSLYRTFRRHVSQRDRELLVGKLRHRRGEK